MIKIKTKYSKCGKIFSNEEINLIIDTVRKMYHTSRCKISYCLCEKLNWYNEVELTVAMFSIVQTCIMHNISPRAYLTYYLEDCAKGIADAKRGSAPDENEIEGFLPYNLPEDIKKKLAINKPGILNHG